MTTADKTIDNGGPAFSVCFEGGQNNGDQPYFHEGMSLRDHFAGQVAQASISGHIAHYGHENYWFPKDIASYAYEVADAMIAARKAI